MAGSIRVLQGGLRGAPRRSALDAAYDHFRLERQGNLSSVATLQHYDYMVRPFLSWLSQGPEVRGFADLTTDVLRVYRANLAVGRRRDGRPLQPASVLDSHVAIGTFLRWAKSEGYDVDARLLEVRRPKVPKKEPTLFHVMKLRLRRSPPSSSAQQAQQARRARVR